MTASLRGAIVRPSVRLCGTQEGLCIIIAKADIATAVRNSVAGGCILAPGDPISRSWTSHWPRCITEWDLSLVETYLRVASPATAGPRLTPEFVLCFPMVHLKLTQRESLDAREEFTTCVIGPCTTCIDGEPIRACRKISCGTILCWGPLLALQLLFLDPLGLCGFHRAMIHVQRAHTMVSAGRGLCCCCSCPK